MQPGCLPCRTSRRRSRRRRSLKPNRSSSDASTLATAIESSSGTLPSSDVSSRSAADRPLRLRTSSSTARTSPRVSKTPSWFLHESRSSAIGRCMPVMLFDARCTQLRHGPPAYLYSRDFTTRTTVSALTTRRRLLMVAFHFPPQSGSSGIQRTLRFARYLPQFGWEPTVLTVHPRAYETTDSTQDIPDGLVVRRALALSMPRATWRLAVAIPLFLRARPLDVMVVGRRARRVERGASISTRCDLVDVSDRHCACNRTHTRAHHALALGGGFSRSDGAGWLSNRSRVLGEHSSGSNRTRFAGRREASFRRQVQRVAIDVVIRSGPRASS